MLAAFGAKKMASTDGGSTATGNERNTAGGFISSLGDVFIKGLDLFASLTYADSALTIASLIGQWMMARKYLENWIIWIVADAAYVVVYFYKDLHLTAILYGVFLILAVIGFIQWRRDVGTYGQA